MYIVLSLAWPEAAQELDGPGCFCHLEDRSGGGTWPSSSLPPSAQVQRGWGWDEDLVSLGSCAYQCQQVQ